MPILLTVCSNINMKNVMKFVKSVKLLGAKLLNQLNLPWFFLIQPHYLMFIMI